MFAYACFNFPANTEKIYFIAVGSTENMKTAGKWLAKLLLLLIWSIPGLFAGDVLMWMSVGSKSHLVSLNKNYNL